MVTAHFLHFSNISFSLDFFLNCASNVVDMTPMQSELLRIVQKEATMDKDRPGGRNELLDCIRSFTVSFVEGATSSSDIKDVLPHFIRCIVRIVPYFSSSPNAPTTARRTQSRDIQQLSVEVSRVFGTVHTKAGSTLQLLPKTAKELWVKELVPLTTAVYLPLERLTNRADAPSQLHSLDEEAIQAMLQVLIDMFGMLICLGLESCQQYLQALQLTWSAVVFLLVQLCADAHTGKAAHLLAVTCQHKAVLVSQASPNVLRDMCPGLFGACYKVCTNATWSSASSLCALLSLLDLIQGVCRDDLPGNWALISVDQPISSSSSSSSSSGVSGSSGGSGLASLLSKLQVSREQEESQPAAAQEVETIYRKQLVARVSALFPQAFMFVYSRVYGQHSAQWRSVLDKLASTLLACQTYLGLQACEQLLLCALRTVHIESEGESASVHALLEHMPPAVQMQVQRGLGEIFLASMQTLRDKVTLDPTLYASTLVLLINIAAVSPLLPATLLAHAALVKSALAHVHRVDLEHSLRCMHIQKTRYTGPPRSGHASSHSADSSYFTLPMMWCGDKEGRRLVRTLTSSLYARSHFFRVFLDDLRTRFDAFAARYSRAGANTSAEVKQFMLEVSQLASCTLVLRSMAFGGRTYELVEERSSSASASIKPSVCAVCSQERSVLRCSRCKAVCYCCAAHQQQHWKEHKGVCREPAACVAAVAAQSVICDTVDPDSILRHNGVTHIACLSSNSVRDIQRLYGVYADILEELRQLQDICPSKELRPYLKLLLCLLCECTGDVAYLYYHDVLQSDSQSKEARVQTLMTCLSLVVSEDRMVRTSALSSLQRFAVYAGNSSLSSMLRSQLDYFIDAVCLHLRSGLSAHSVQRFSSFPLPEMIQFVFKETQLGVSEFITTGRDRENSGLMSTLQAPLQLLRDLVQDTMDFVDAQASLHSLSSVGSVVSLLCVLDGFVGAIPVSTSNDSTAQREAEDNKGDSTNNPSDETHNGGHAADIDEDEQNDQDESIALEADEYSTSKHPENMQILSPLITRVVYFLSLPSPLVQQKVYRLLMLIFPRLRDSCMQDLNTNIHGVWQTLCRCLSQYVELYRIRYVGEDISKRRVVDRRRLLELRTYVEEAKRHDGVSKDYLYSLLHSLPPLLDLLELLISLSAQFIRSKLQEDVLPLIHNLLFASHYVHCKQGKQQAPGSGAQGLVLSAAFDFLLVVAERPELAPLRKQYGRLWMWLVVPFVDDKENNNGIGKAAYSLLTTLMHTDSSNQAFQPGITYSLDMLVSQTEVQQGFMHCLTSEDKRKNVAASNTAINRFSAYSKMVLKFCSLDSTLSTCLHAVFSKNASIDIQELDEGIKRSHVS